MATAVARIFLFMSYNRKYPFSKRASKVLGRIHDTENSFIFISQSLHSDDVLYGTVALLASLVLYFMQTAILVLTVT